MSLADYLALSDRVSALRSRADAEDLVASLGRAALHPMDRRVLARRLARAAQAIDPTFALEVETSDNVVVLA